MVAKLYTHLTSQPIAEDRAIGSAWSVLLFLTSISDLADAGHQKKNPNHNPNRDGDPGASGQIVTFHLFHLRVRDHGGGARLRVNDRETRIVSLADIAFELCLVPEADLDEGLWTGAQFRNFSFTFSANLASSPAFVAAVTGVAPSKLIKSTVSVRASSFLVIKSSPRFIKTGARCKAAPTSG